MLGVIKAVRAPDRAAAAHASAPACPPPITTTSNGLQVTVSVSWSRTVARRRTWFRRLLSQGDAADKLAARGTNLTGPKASDAEERAWHAFFRRVAELP